MKIKHIFIFFLIIIFVTSCTKNDSVDFDGKNAFEYAKIQVDFGPRIPGSEAHQNTVDFMISELEKNGWETEIQSDLINDYTLKNVIGYRNDQNTKPWIILAVHYDSRFFADNDPDLGKRSNPVDGANDGASGVAVLLELSRIIPKDLPKNVWLVFFDVEDQGNIDNWDWILGSRSFVNQLEGIPESVVILDMIGDKDLNIYYEKNSDSELQQEIWKIAAELGYEQFFIPEYKYSILDDHIPFIEKGITAIDIIDFDYVYWHTTEDTIDKISPESLEVVGRTIFHWLLVP
ncbi:MAG TPA: M28 family peptidase [Anaerolineaceae bacterium]|nr:M28 family peptidase [Anaerolineaceae bacterium]